MEGIINDKGHKELEKILQEVDFSVLKAFDMMPVMVWINNTSSECIFLNRKWHEITGQALEKGLGLGWTEMIHPDDLTTIDALIKEDHQQHLPLNFEYRIKNSSGRYRWYLCSAEPQFDALNNFKGYIGTSIDIHDRKQSEEALRAGERHYKIFTEAMPAMAFIADASGKIIFYNKRFYEYSGLTPDVAEGWGWMNIPVPHPDDLQRTIDTWNHALKTGTYYQIEYRLRRHDGEYIWHKAQAIPLLNDKGKAELWLGTNTDIHDLKQAQELLLKELEERKMLEDELSIERELFKTIFDTIPIMLTIYDPEIKVTRLNNALTTITGWTAHDYTRRSIMELAYPDPAYRKSVAGYMASLAPGFKDILMVTKDGRTLQTSWSNIRISDGRNVGIGIDVTEQRIFEKRLSELSQQLNSVVENITDGVIVYDSIGRELNINKAARRINASHNYFNSNDDNSMKLFDLQGHEVDHYNWPKSKILRGEYIQTQEFLSRNTLTGYSAYLEFSGIPVFEDNKLKLAILTFRDTTQRKKAQIELEDSLEKLRLQNEELEKANNLHENLLYIIAHDLRNPIGNMYLIIDLLRGANSTAEKENLVVMLKDMVKRQENIVLGLVELLEVQNPEKMSPCEVDLEELLKEILRDNEVILRDCGARVKIDFPHGAKINYISSFADSILKNLINNSIKYRHLQEPLELIISGEPRGEYLVVSVQDNGIGVDLNRFREQLFKPFKRFTQQSAGTGMGLYLLKNLIEKNGGYIEVESEPDLGSTFRCFFCSY